MVTILIIWVLIMIYLIYQHIRTNKVYKIRILWGIENDSRRYKYSYKEMRRPNLKNWYGLRYPKEKHYK